MAVTQPQRTGLLALPTKLGYILGAVRFQESVFALPFAYVAMLMAADGWPTLGQFVWITVAMTAARTLAMAGNRLIQRKEDAANPRTANRHLPRGLLKPWEMALVMVVCAGVFFYAASQLNSLALALAPVALAVVIGYSFVKYHTWATHFCIGVADSIAAAGAWIGVRGRLDPEGVVVSFALACFICGFDIFYAIQDMEFDRRYGVHSIPKRFGVPMALWWARGMHALTSASLLAVGIWLELSAPYYIGWAIATALLVYEHSLLKPDDLSKLNVAFFNFNGAVSLILLLFTSLAVLL